MNRLGIRQRSSQPSNAGQLQGKRVLNPRRELANGPEATLLPPPAWASPPRITTNGSVTEAVLGPVLLTTATMALMRQSQLHVPAKLVRRHTEQAEILIELPCGGTPETITERLGRTSTATLAWLSQAQGYRSSEPHLSATMAVQIREAISALGWRLVNGSAGHYIVAPALGGLSRRLLIDPSLNGHLRISLPPRRVSIEEWRCTKAMILFALEANSRFRLARLTITPVGNGSAVITYEQVILATEPLDDWLVKAASALLVAAETTERSVRALAHAAVASAYLRGVELKRAASGTRGWNCQHHAGDLSQRC